MSLFCFPAPIALKEKPPSNQSRLAEKSDKGFFPISKLRLNYRTAAIRWPTPRIRGIGGYCTELKIIMLNYRYPQLKKGQLIFHPFGSILSTFPPLAAEPSIHYQQTAEPKTTPPPSSLTRGTCAPCALASRGERECNQLISNQFFQRRSKRHEKKVI